MVLPAVAYSFISAGPRLLRSRLSFLRKAYRVAPAFATADGLWWV